MPTLEKPSVETRRNLYKDSCIDTNKGKTNGMHNDPSGETRRSRDNTDTIDASGKTRQIEFNLEPIANNRTNNTI